MVVSRPISRTLFRRFSRIILSQKANCGNRPLLIKLEAILRRRSINGDVAIKHLNTKHLSSKFISDFMYRRPTLYPLEIAVDFLKSP